MKHRNPEFEDQFDDFNARREAQRFEALLGEDKLFFMDLMTIEEIFDFYLAHSEFTKAAQLIDFAEQQYPVESQIKYRKALLLLEQGKFRLAEEAIELALQFSPTNSDFLALKARILLENGFPDEALELLEDTMSFAEESAELYFQTATVCQRQQKYKEAIRYYQLAYQLDNTQDDVLFHLTECFEQTRQFENGVKYLDSLLDENPYNVAAWYNYALLQYAWGRPEQALDAFEYVLAIDDTFLPAYHGKGNILLEMERYPDALRVFLTAIGFDAKDPALMLNIGECYEELGNFKRARFYYNKCSVLYPELPDPWYGIGATLEAEGKLLQAVSYYKKTIEIDENHYDAWLGLAEVEYDLGNEYSAFEALMRAISLDPEDLEMWESWSEKLDENGQTEAAIFLLSEAMQLNSDSITLMYRAAALAFKAGFSRDAFAYLENALLADFEGHKILYKICPKIVTLRPIQELIEQYRPR